MDEHTEANLTWFFNAIAPLESAYGDPWFSFVLHCGADGPALIASALVLQPLAIDQQERTVEAGQFYGFSGRLNSLGVSPHELLRLVLAGYLPAADRTWVLARGAQQMRPIIFRSPSTNADNRQKVIEIFGAGLSAHVHPIDEDNWALRSSGTPYSDLNDLLQHLRLERGSHQLHVIAWPPVLVDSTSRVRGETAELRLICSAHLPPSKVSLGVVVSNREGVQIRARIAGEKFDWVPSEQSGDVLIGAVTLPVPKASVVHCFATFEECCLHHELIGDPDATQNPLRSIYEIFDPRLDNTLAMLRQVPSKGQSQGLEAAVTGLLWLLGFAPLHLGGGRTDAPDVITVSRDGHVIVVECTLTDPKTKKHNKVQKLLDRTNEVRAALQKSNFGSVVCIPVLAISRMRSSIEEEVLDCERRGIVVYTQEDVESIIASTLWAPRSELRYMELKQRLEDAIDRFKNEERQQTELVKTVQGLKATFDRVGRGNLDI